MYILGISAFYHDSAACLLLNDSIVAAAQEERFTRKKHDPSFPANAIRFCLEFSGLNLDELDAIVFYEKPFFVVCSLKYRRISFFNINVFKFILTTYYTYKVTMLMAL